MTGAQWDKVVLFLSGGLLGCALTLQFTVGQQETPKAIFYRGIIAEQLWDNCRYHFAVLQQSQRDAWQQLFFTMPPERFAGVGTGGIELCHTFQALLPK